MPSPTSWSNTSYVSLTHSQNIDALLHGTRWAGSNVTYSFPGYSSIWSTRTTTGYGPSRGNGEPWSTYFDALSTSDQTYFIAVLRQWANVANLQFTLVADTSTSVGDIRAAYTSLSSGAQASAYLPGNSSAAGDIWINSGGTSAAFYWTLGSYESFTVLHELGHVLGLKHPFEVGGLSGTILPSSLDTQSYTVMSYAAQVGDIAHTTNFSFYPTTPMILDIQAIQYVYGANNSYHTEDDTYSYSDATTYHETIWDAGGTDTIKYTGYKNSAIDLRSGYGSGIGQNVYVQSAYGENLQAVNNVWIAYNATIENAIGGSGKDILTGNDANNSLDGGAGNDTMDGGAGNDIISGGAGIDISTYPAVRASYAITKTSTGYTVSGGAGGTDTLANIERLQFADTKVAIDLDGNAGTTAKILGSVFGATSVSNASYVGIGLSYLDGGMSHADLMALALNAAGATTNAAAVNLLWANLFGVAPAATEAAPYVAMLDNGSLSAGALGVLAADTSFNAAHINLVGLAQTGITYV